MNQQLEQLIKYASLNAKDARNCKIEQHAALFALITRAVIDAKGEDDGKDSIIKAITKYAEERGARMAETARANGDEINIATFVAYGEWQAEEGEKEDVIEQQTPSFVTNTILCPWNEAWKKHGLEEFGRYYCVTVDDALWRGFSPGDECTVASTLTWGGDKCRFDWNKPMSDDDFSGLVKKQKELGTTFKRDFNYHTAHLLNTVFEYLIDKYSNEGVDMVSHALKEFTELFSEDYLVSLIGKY